MAEEQTTGFEVGLRHELQVIEMVNFLLREGALSPQFRARFGLDNTETITVRFIRMSEALQKGLDYPTKLSRQPRLIERLLADGEAQANAFLAELDAVARPGELTAQPSLERH